MASSNAESRPAKKAKTIAKSWKNCLTENMGLQGKVFGLKDLFAHGFDSTGANHGFNDRSPAGTTAAASAGRCASSNQQANKFYTLRLEHRTGGAMAQFRGEERILLFRSDRPGAIAKIIYSSQLPERGKSLKYPALLAADDSGAESQVAHAYSTAYAKVHVLDVKAQYRGKDLGGLLFSEAMASLKSRYCRDDDCDVEPSTSQERGGDAAIVPVKSNKQVYDVECMLDAEEEVTRHGKLVSFYEHLGCRVKPSKRVQYVNNNDSETYRKVPMQIDLHPPRANSPSKQARARVRRRKFSHLVSSKGSFLPVQLVGSMGRLYVRSHLSQEVMELDWLVTETPDGCQFCTTHGHLLLAFPNGSVSVLSPGDQDNDDDSDLDIDTNVLNKWAHFVPFHVSDEDNTEGGNPSQGESSRSLWVLRTCHGTFLTADSLRKTLSCTRIPSFWQANVANLSLVCTSDTPPRRHHYRKCWKFQTYEYVTRMRSRFLDFSLGKATLIEALGWIHAFPAHPFHVWSSDESSPESSQDSSPSLRTLCFLMAETARQEGLPDWVQLIALFHELGEAVKVLDFSTGEMAKSIYDWTISSRSRVVGCKIPQRATFSEFRYLNMDEEDSRYNTDTGAYSANCSLENVCLMWSGCEYMYYLLKHNNAALPKEAYAIIRYFLLGDWHEHGEYSLLTDAMDEDVLPFVQAFNALRRSVRLKCVDCGDLSDEQCGWLWDSHYAGLAAKYKCDHVLNW